MEGLKRRLLALVLMVCITTQAYATQHVVGGSDGWDESTDYNSWAKGQTFKVGDTLGKEYVLLLFALCKKSFLLCFV